MKKINIVLVSAISLLLSSTYGIAGGKNTYHYVCDTDKCCQPGSPPGNDCGSNSTKFVEEESNGVTRGGGKHEIKPRVTKHLVLTCKGNNAQGYKLDIGSGGNITCPLAPGYVAGMSKTLKVNCLNSDATKAGTVGVKFLSCKPGTFD